MAATTTLIDEAVSAARGCFGLLVGDRRAAHHFDFSRRGLAGSYIAFLLAGLLNAYLPILLGRGDDGLPASRALIMVAVIYAGQVGFSVIVLRQLKRLDGLVPYLVADNWTTFYLTIVSALLTVVGFGGDLALIFLAILIMVLEVNLARLIVTLRPLQIAMFLIAQIAGVLLTLLIIGMIIPLPPELTATPPA